MQRKQLKNILDIVFKEKHKEDERQIAFDAFTKVYAEDGYCCLDSSITVILNVIGEIDPMIAQDLSYFLYEAKSFYPNCRITYNDKEWIITDEESAKEYLLEIHGE